jgi:hypothetical protein
VEYRGLTILNINMAEKKEEVEVEVSQEDIDKAEEQILLSWLASQILANELFDVAKLLIGKSALITAHNMKVLDADSTKFQKNKADKSAKDFLEKVRFDQEQYVKYGRKIPGYVQRSERYENVLKDVINHLSVEARKAMDEALEKHK